MINIMESPHIEDFVIIVAVTLFYGLAYERMNPKDFGFKSKIDPYYFAFTTMSSVGYGDFSPKTDEAKLVVMSQQVIILMGELYLTMKYIGSMIRSL